MNVRLAIIPWALLRGWAPAKRIRRGRLVRVCGLMLWRAHG